MLTKKTKIVCTLGPASDSVEKITAMIRAGMAVARLNFSHGSYEHHEKLLKTVRSVAKKLGKKVLVMQDLQGPKIRVGPLATPVPVTAGTEVVIGKTFTSDFDFAPYVKKDDRVLIEDGLIELTVTRASGGLVRCNVVNDGLVQAHKGINLPDSKLTFSGLTEKDKEDLTWGLTHGVDMVAVSFVRTAADVLEVKTLMKKQLNGKTLPVVPKIEKPEALQNFTSILKVSDWIMVARGDLGVEIHAAAVPLIQKDLIKRCNKVGKPVIVATQMLQSMVENPRATRAEVSDVANAVLDGADYVMLSGESAFGKYPLEAVSTMEDIITTVTHARKNIRA